MGAILERLPLLVNALAYIINITRMNNGTKYGFKRN